MDAFDRVVAQRMPISQLAGSLVLLAAVLPATAFSLDYYQQQQAAQRQQYEQQQAQQRQQQYQFQAYQQRQQYEQQQRQQAEQLQQRNQESLQQLQQQQSNRQQQQNQQAQEDYSRRQREQYAQEEEDRRKRLRKLNRSVPYYETETASPAVEPAPAEAVSPAVSADPATFANDQQANSGGVLLALVWVLAMFALVVFCVSVGAGITLLLLQRRNPQKSDPAAQFGFAMHRFQQKAAELTHRFGLWTGLAAAKARRSLGAFLDRTKQRLVRLIPSRRLAWRLTFVALGIALMTASGFCFLESEIFKGFVAMTLGYLVVVAVWFAPAFAHSATDDAFDNLTPTLEEVRPSPVLASQASASGIDLISLTLDSDHSQDTHHSSVDHTSAHMESPVANVDPSRMLCCTKCKARYNVTGEGEVSFRLIPCPRCGVALQRLDRRPTNMVDGEFQWAPIVSVPCAQCHRLIDVPYASIGGSVNCPRCEANLPVPDTENRVKLLRQMSTMSRA